MQLYERVKHLRKSILKLSQEEFSAKINISRSNLGGIETGRVNITSRVISDICTAFGINREWLETGSGEMFADTFESYINDVCERLKLNEFGKRALIAYLQLSETEQKALAKFAELIAAGKPTDNYTEILSAARAPNSQGAEKIELDSETLEKLENAPDKSHLY